MVEWRDIPGYTGRYEVSSDGQVRNKVTGVLRRAWRNNMGYFCVDLPSPDNADVKKRYRYLISRLVALAFIPNPENKPCIDHINTDRTDNRVENLRWVTQQENLANPISRARLNEALHIAKSTPEAIEKNRQAMLKCKGTKEARAENERVHSFQKKRVRCIETGEEWTGAHAAERALGYKYGRIGQMCRKATRRSCTIGSRDGKAVLHFIYVD